MMGQTKIHPGWLDENTVCYIAKRAVYGTAGENLELATVGADGKGRKSHQVAIDLEAGRWGRGNF